MSVPAPRLLGKPVLGAYQPDAAGRCIACGRQRQLCSASCREAARKLRPPKKRVRQRCAEPMEPAWEVADFHVRMRHIITVGQALYGRDWKRPTARAIGVDIKRIWRWMHGQGTPTTHNILRLLEVVRRRVDHLNGIHNAVLQQLPGRPYP